MIVHSFDDVLRQPKTLHAVELTPGGQTKIPLWRPVPWIGIGYFVVIELVLAVAAKTMILDWPYEVVSAISSPLVYYTVIPIGLVVLSFQVELDGLAPHWWLLAWVLYKRRPKRLLAGESVPMPGTKIHYGGKVKIWWDLNAPRLHSGWVTGGRISTSVPIRFTYAIFHRRQVIKPDSDGKMVTDYEVDKKLRVRA
jgi:hypothetical protein